MDQKSQLPSLEDLLGVTQKAEQDAQVLLNLAVNMRHFRNLQQTEGLNEDDPIPGQQSNGSPPRTFKEQYELIQKAYKQKWESIEAEGHRAVVEAKLQEAKK